jgi:hypothetical protein
MMWPAVLLFLFLPLSASAAPDLGTYQDVEKIRVFRDHENQHIWYLTPAPPALGKGSDRTPDYGLDIYRYLGRKGTGDQDLFWVKGVFSAGVMRDRDAAAPGRIRSALKSQGVADPRLRSMPVAGAQVKLLFADQGQTWNQGSRWAAERLILLLDRDLAEILWEAVQVDQTLVSFAVEERLTGVRWMEDKWVESETVVASTLPMDLDIKAHPHKFRRTDLGGRMVRGYTGVDVFCFDFLEELDLDLYAKLVEVAIPTTGRDLVEEVTFRANQEYRARIEFKLAKDLDQPYRVRITRILKDGRRDVGPWVAKQGEAMLDVTAYREPEEKSGVQE